MDERTTWPPQPDRTPALPVAVDVLRVVMLFQVLLGLLALPVAAFFVIGDLSDDSDEWDGLAAFLGALLGGAGLLLIVVGALVFWLLRRKPVVAGGIATAMGALLLLQGVQGAAFGVGGAEPWVVLVGLLLAVPGAVVTWTAWAETRV